MKEATGETSMTVITIAAVAVIGGILVMLWPSIKAYINSAWGNVFSAQDGDMYTGKKW